MDGSYNNRTMKKLIFTLAFMLIGTLFYGQSLNVIDYSSNISKEKKVTIDTKSEIVTTSGYSENLGGTIIFTGYEEKSEFKIISVSLAKSNN